MIMFKMFYCNLEFGYALDTNSSYNFFLLVLAVDTCFHNMQHLANSVQSLMFIVLGFFYLKLLMEEKKCLIPPHK
jgi:hypothetical protein